MSMLKCPNPSCPYVFDPAQVPAGVVLSCPRCGMQFTLGPPAAQPPAPQQGPPPGYGAPVGYGSPNFPPLEEPVNPEFEAVGRAAEEDRAAGEPLPGRRTSKAQVFILAGIAAALMAGTGLAIYFKLTRKDKDRPEETFTRFPDFNVGYDPFPEAWSRDEGERAKLGSPYQFFYKRESPEAYFAFGARDYKDHVPRASELRHRVNATMKKLFVEYEEMPPADSTWLGQPLAGAAPFRNGFRFRSRSKDGLVWQGEAYTVTAKGVGYWWVCWCPESEYDGLKSEFASLRGKFKPLDLREKWTPSQSNVAPYKGGTVTYTVLDADAIWKELAVEEFKASEPDLDKWLIAELKPESDSMAVPARAELKVYLIDPAEDPLAAARKHVEAKLNQRIKEANEDFPSLTFTERTGPVEGDEPGNLIPPTATVVRLEARLIDPNTKKVIAATESRLHVISAMRSGDKTVVIHTWCDLKEKEVFEAMLVQLAGSLRER